MSNEVSESWSDRIALSGVTDRFMNNFSVSFAGTTVTIGYNTSEALAHLIFLFADVSIESTEFPCSPKLFLTRSGESNEYQFRDGSTVLCRGALDIKFSAHLFDTVIFHLLNKADSGIALHAGGIVCDGKTILLPGLSGAGKSTLTALLISKHCTYLTDELVYISRGDHHHIQYFSRPICLKADTVPLILELLPNHCASDVLQDRHGAIIPHRCLNPKVGLPYPPPSLIVLPSFKQSIRPELEKISRARLITLLMGCHVNARNLADHGFKEITEIARSTPAYLFKYGCLEDVDKIFINIGQLQ